MGMDVYGRENDRAYFRASVWGWRPLHLLIQEANARFELGISKECLAAMANNEGAGLETQTECDRLAEALENLLPEYETEIVTYDAEPQGVEGQVLQALLGAGWAIPGSPSYRIHKDHVKEFVEFLRECGGFCVW